MMNEKRNVPPTLAIMMALLVVTFAAYSQVLRNDFINLDDDIYVTANPRVLSGLTGNNVRWAFTTFHATNWHPLTWMSHMLDCELYGLNALGHHLTSVLLHAASALLLFLILARMTAHPWRSAFAAALFVLHPLHVESVAWIAERKDVLSALFWMLTMFAYERYVARPSLRRYMSVPVFMALGLMAKPMLVTLPFVLLMLDFWPLERWRPRGAAAMKNAAAGKDATAGKSAPSAIHLILEKLPLLVLSAISGIITVRAQSAGGAVAGTDVTGIGERVINAMIAYVSYLAQMMWPAGLAVYYPRPSESPGILSIAGAGLVLVLITGLALWMGIKRRYLITGWLWYVVTLVPVIGLLQVGYQSRADRYTYIPLIGIFIMVSWGVPELVAGRTRAGRGERRRGEVQARRGRRGLIPSGPLAALAVVALVAVLAITWRQVGYWRTSGTLFEHAIAVTRSNYLAHNNLGTYLLGQNRAGEALAHFREAVRLRPDFAPALFNVALIEAGQGNKGEAIAAFTTGLAIMPNEASAHYSLGTLLYETGKVDEAMHHYREAIRLKPDYAKAEVNLGVAYVKRGEFSDGMVHFLRAISIDPKFAEAHGNLALALYYMGRYAEAWDAIHTAQALGMAPNPRLLNDLSARMKEPVQ